MQNGDRGLNSWEQGPTEPNPDCVGFVLYHSLGPDRRRLIKTRTGNFLWEMLMAGLEPMDSETPMPIVCDIMISLLKIVLGGTPEIPVSHSEREPVLQFHRELQKDTKLKSRIRVMISNLETIRDGGKIR